MMNKNEYLRILSQRLSVLSADEYNNIMQYYTEYFEEAGMENEANVIAELGDVNALADRILKENGQPVFNGQQYNQSQSYNQPQGAMCSQSFGQAYTEKLDEHYQSHKKEMSTGAKVLLAIVTIPLWIVMGVLVFSFGVAAVSVLVSSVAVIIAGFATMGGHFATGIAFVGSGLIVVAVGMGLLMATGGIAQGTKAMYRAIFKRSETASM